MIHIYASYDVRIPGHDGKYILYVYIYIYIYIFKYLYIIIKKKYIIYIIIMKSKNNEVSLMISS